MGQFPVISVSFKEVEGKNYHKAIQNFIATIAYIYKRFAFLKNSTKAPKELKNNFEDRFAFCWDDTNDFRDEGVLSRAELIVGDFLPDLAYTLYREFERKVIIIIDEYDVPLQMSVAAEAVLQRDARSL